MIPADLRRLSRAELLALVEQLAALRPDLLPLIEGLLAPPALAVSEPLGSGFDRPPALVRGGAGSRLLDQVLPLIAQAHDVAIVAAFTYDRGLLLLQRALSSALARQARVRILTGDYRGATEVRALWRLLDWARAAPEGRLEARVIEIERLSLASFHPKSWRFERPQGGAAFVGSSNFSHTALCDGVEWNLRIDQPRDPAGYAEVVAGFEALWEQAEGLSADWIRRYQARLPALQERGREGDAGPEPASQLPAPHAVQREALEALARSRAEGRDRALVVLATGLGKTLLAAFDALSLGREQGRSPRVLLIAHRAELLRQAADAFRSLQPDLRTGWFIAQESSLEGDLVLAGIQKLSRAEGLAALRQQRFDYVIIDEVHHAAATSYRRVLAALQPGFLLGLTATPERADGADILSLFGDHVAYRADLGAGVQRGFLVPFRYLGLKDPTDFAPIPWRNGRFDPEILSDALQTHARMEALWGAWQEHPGVRTLVFCASVAHADFCRDWLAERGLRVAALHSGEGAADRESALKMLEEGQLDAITSVDLLNEGVDVRPVDRVVMLRPTESPVIFLQQLGRGLRTAPGKERLVVLDFVGNHRVFLGRVRTLLSLGRASPSLRGWLEGREGAELPPGCSVDVALEAKDLLRHLLPAAAANRAVEVYRERKAARGARPTAGELQRRGLSVRSLRHVEGWFGFVRDEGDLSADELGALAADPGWLLALEAVSDPLPLLALEALLEGEALRAGMAAGALRAEVVRRLERAPELRQGRDPAALGEEALSGLARSRLVRLGDGRWQARAAIPLEPGKQQAFEQMTAELVDLGLARLRLRAQPGAVGASFVAKVTWNQRDPILKLPSRGSRPDLPEGETDVQLPDGSTWIFRLMREFCNVARPAGSRQNQLPDLLRRWFGPAAGHPGTGCLVRFTPSPDGWWIEPEGGPDQDQPAEDLAAFPSLEATAGLEGRPLQGAPGVQRVRLPGRWEREQGFAVRVAGASMDGGSEPMREGDWAILRWARAARPAEVEGQVALVTLGRAGARLTHHLKRVRRAGGSYQLCSDNPLFPPIPAGADAQVVALRQGVVRPEDLAPPVGALLAEGEVAAAFQLSRAPAGEISRVDGHLFLRIDRADRFREPDRLGLAVLDRGPGETAYILAESEPGRWRYCGVGRWVEGAWRLPDLDFATWRRLGRGRGASRRLEAEWEEAARALVARLLEDPGPGSWIEARGRRCRLVGRSARGGVRIDGGDGGFGERTVSPLDLAWALKTRSQLPAGAPLSEAAVNRRRYLEGTPKGATRWIDTGWALALTEGLPR